MTEVKFKLDEDPIDYTLRYSFNELADAETVTGRNLLLAMKSVVDGQASATELRALLYALLRPAHPQVLVAEAGDLLGRGKGTVVSAMQALIVAEFEPDSEDADPATDGAAPAPQTA